jgi:hypothetical protein
VWLRNKKVCQGKSCLLFAVGVAEEWTKIPGVKGAQRAKIAKMMLRKNWTERDK